MNIHKIIERVVFGIIAICFSFTATYVPNSFSNVKQAEAAGAMGIVEDIYVGAQTTFLNATALASKAYQAVSAWADTYIQSKEAYLDGIAWVMAKAILSNMARSIVNWINTGFEGSPSFVQDMRGFLLTTADEVLGQYLLDMDELAFLCDPFRLDVRIALATVLDQTRDNTAPSCTLTGALANIESFMAGNFSDGGWDAWLSITTQPETYTAYGQFLTSERLAKAKAEEAKINQKAELSYGGGFLSSKICELIEGESEGGRESCVISTPGKVIQDALTFQLSTGPESLIAADEINEILAALFTYLQQEAITGAAGLLGLSEGTGYTTEGYTSGSYLGDMVLEGNLDTNRFRETVVEGLSLEREYYAAATEALPLLIAYVSTSSDADPTRKDNARDEIERINRLLPQISANISALESVLSRWDGLPAVNADTDATSRQRRQIIEDYSRLELHHEVTIEADKLAWTRIIRTTRPLEADTTEADNEVNETQATLNQIEANTSDGG